MTQYNGSDWPYEALVEQMAALKDDEVQVLLLGESQDVGAIREIVSTYSYLMRYGRPFQPLYGYVVVRPDEHLLFRFESPFSHTQFTVSPSRIQILQKMIEECPTLLYQLVYMKDGQKVVERNFEYGEQGTLNSALEEALLQRGWTKKRQVAKKFSPYMLGPYEHARFLREIKQGRKPVLHTWDRWWHQMYHCWHKK